MALPPPTPSAISQPLLHPETSPARRRVRDPSTPAPAATTATPPDRARHPVGDRGARTARAQRGQDPAPVGVGAVQRALDQHVLGHAAGRLRGPRRRWPRRSPCRCRPGSCPRRRARPAWPAPAPARRSAAASSRASRPPSTATPEAPFASRKTQSLVLVQPSTEIALNEPSTASASTRRSVAGGTSASVVTCASVVAMSGRIMPAPLAMPPIRTLPPASVTAARASLGNGVGGADRLRRPPAVGGAQRSGGSADAGRDVVDRQRPSRSRRSRRPAPAPAGSPAPGGRLGHHRPGVVAARLRRCRRWRSPALVTTARATPPVHLRPADGDRRGHHPVGGEDAGRGSRAGRTRAGPGRRLPLRFMPQAASPAEKPLGWQHAALTATQALRGQAHRLGQAQHQVRVLDRPGRPRP